MSLKQSGRAHLVVRGDVSSAGSSSMNGVASGGAGLRGHQRIYRRAYVRGVPDEPSALSQNPMYGNPSRTRCARISSSRRSEEHTSELQSQSNLVCRLLLEKKKKNCIHSISRQSHKGEDVHCL